MDSLDPMLALKQEPSDGAKIHKKSEPPSDSKIIFFFRRTSGHGHSCDHVTVSWQKGYTKGLPPL